MYIGHANGMSYTLALRFSCYIACFFITTSTLNTSD